MRDDAVLCRARCGYRVITPTSFRLNRSVTFTPFLRLLITNDCFLPKLPMAHVVPRQSPQIASQSHPFVSAQDSLAPQVRHRGQRPLFRLGFGRSLPFCQWSVRNRLSDSIAFADRHPAIFASGNSRAAVCVLKPRNNTRRFRPMVGMCFVVVRKCAVKWVLCGINFIGT